MLNTPTLPASPAIPATAAKPPLTPLPKWAQQLQDTFRAGAASQFILYGNTMDIVPHGEATVAQPLSLKKYLADVMLAGFDTVITYDRGKGIRAVRGDKDWSEWLTSFTGNRAMELLAGSMREPLKALELIDLYILRSLNLQAIQQKSATPKPASSTAASAPATTKALKIAVIIDFAAFIVPKGDPVQLSGDIASHIVKILGWANDPAILQSNIATFLITERISDLNDLITDNAHTAKIELKFPSEADILSYLKSLQASVFPKLLEQSDMSLEVMAKRLTGLSRIDAKNVISSAITNGERVTEQLLSGLKKELIEKECQDLLEFFESPYTLDLVSGHEPVKAWLRQDATLLKTGKSHALPMGYLITGRIGTGKTFIVQCWAGELGIPCVVLKNFRDKWVGSTEGKLEKIFSVLHALGQVVVFVDEADQMTGKREGGSSDSGLGGRVYAMLAKEMSDTRNRGKIIWVFATSRPDLVEVDLKRQGRLDVHIPLFVPQSQAEYHALFLAVAKKLKFPLKPEDLPPIPESAEFGGHEIEGMLVRALRQYELAGDVKPSMAEIFKGVVADMKPNAYTKKLEYMDLVAVRECTDASFLPEKFKNMPPEMLEQRIEELRRYV
ncbi:MAG: ATP-binding protein [Rhizobacter sp.]|nr:ATP-binding protein [Chlorobiales bacterium]